MMPLAPVPAPRPSQDQPAGRSLADRGQALVLFVLFLLVLLGASAIAIDYANWLLIDRRLQNVADHVSLAGASVFGERDPDKPFTCAGTGKCDTAREQAWTAFNQELNLGLNAGQIACLAGADTPQAGWGGTAAAGCGGGTDFGHTLWVSTPPPGNSSYTGLGGWYPDQYGIVFARVDEPTRTFLGGIFGITPSDRIGWATAGATPTAFALQIFCQDNCSPNQPGLSIDGQGGIRLVRGDIGGNKKFDATSQNNKGAIVENGQVFLVDAQCHTGQQSYNCPETPATTGGIANADPTDPSSGAVNKRALHIGPLPVPEYPSPLGGVTIHDYQCAGAGPGNLCVPRQGANETVRAGDWTCGPGSTTDLYCGVPTVTSGNVVCDVSAAELADATADHKPPMIPPGYYHSIEVPADGCAILDPTAENSGGLYPYQLPGIYEFDGRTYAGKKGKIELHDNAYLVGDGVTFVFDTNWPDPAGNQGFVLPPNSALVLNTYKLDGTTPPCVSAVEVGNVDMSGNWWTEDLPYSAVCAAWEVNPVTLAGGNAWAYCTDSTSCSTSAYERDAYSPLGPDTSTDPDSRYRGITFYFTPEGGFSAPQVNGRFLVGGNSGDQPGIAFRAVMYAPYDDVKMTGGNGFNTVGQVMAWTAKFNGGSAYIDLDYPYDYPPGEPYLLEPTLGQ